MEPEAIEIWNAATALGGAEGSEGAPQGVAHLARLLRFHNAAMGGGLSFAVEIGGPDLAQAAREASEYFELEDLAAVLTQLIDGNLDYDLAEELNDAYYEASGEDAIAEGLIEKAFERKLASSPSDFA